MFKRLRGLFSQPNEKLQQEDQLPYEDEQVPALLEDTNRLLGKIDNVLEENEDDFRPSEISVSDEQTQNESAEKRGFFGVIGKKSREAGKWVSETAREGAEGAKKIASALRQNPELRKEIASKLEVGAERWLSLKGGGDILKAFAGKGDIASLARGMFEKSGEIKSAQEKVEMYGTVIEAHRKEFEDSVKMNRFNRVLELLGKNEEEIAEITKDGYNNDLYLQYKHALEAAGTYIVWARQGEENSDKLKETKARIESKHRADPEKAGAPVKVLIIEDGRNDVFRKGLEQWKKEDIQKITEEKRGKHTRVNRDQQEIVRRVLATIAAHSENRVKDTREVMKANVEGVVNAWDEWRDLGNFGATAMGRIELRAVFAMLTRIGKGAHEAIKTRERDAITLDYEREKSRLLAHEERYGARVAEIQQLRERLSSGATLENQEFLNELMEFNRTYRREAQDSLDDAEKPSYEKDEFIEFFKTNDLEKYLKTSESQYANSLDKLRIAHKGILESGDGEDPELGRLWYLKKTICDKARSTARVFKVWENRSTLRQKQGAVRNIISAGQGFGDVFRFMRFGHDAEDLTENIIHGEVFGKEGGFLRYIKEGGEELASRFYEGDLTRTLIDRHLHRDDLSEERREILTSLQEKLSHGGKMTDVEQDFLQKIEEQARDLHRKELSGGNLSEFERMMIGQAKHEAAEEYGAKSVLEKIGRNLGEYNVKRSLSTLTELPDRLKRIVNITERGTGSVIAHLDRTGANIARNAYGRDLTALMFQKSQIQFAGESVSGTRAIPNDSRERLFGYFTGEVKRDELTSEDEKYLQEIEREAAGLFDKQKSGAELTDEEAALVGAAEHKALIDYMDDGVFEKIAGSAGRIREALQGIPDPVLRAEAETQLALIETDPKKFAEGLRVCGAGMLGFGVYGKANPEIRKRMQKRLRDEEGFSKIGVALGIGGAAILGTLAFLAYKEWGDDIGLKELIENNEIKTENETLLRTKTTDGSKIVTINWHASDKQKELPSGEIAEKEAFIPKSNKVEVHEKTTDKTPICSVNYTPTDQQNYFLFSRTESTESTENLLKTGVIMMDSAFDQQTDWPFTGIKTVIKTGEGEVRIPFDQLHCNFSQKSTENEPILLIRTNDMKSIEVYFSSDRSTVSLIDSTEIPPVVVINNIPITDLSKYFDAQGNFIKEPAVEAQASEEKPEPPKYPTTPPADMTPQGESFKSLADALIGYSHVDGAIKAEIEAQIADVFNEKQYSNVQFPDSVRDIIVDAALAKTDAINADKKIDASDAQARAELEKITKMIPRLQTVLKREGLTLEKVKDDLAKAQTIDDLEKFIDGHEKKVWGIMVKRSQELGATEKTKAIEKEKTETVEKKPVEEEETIKKLMADEMKDKMTENWPEEKLPVTPKTEEAPDIKKILSTLDKPLSKIEQLLSAPEQEKSSYQVTQKWDEFKHGEEKTEETEEPSQDTLWETKQERVPNPFLLPKKETAEFFKPADAPSDAEHGPTAFDVQDFIETEKSTSTSALIDKLSEVTDAQAEEIFQNDAMKARCREIPNAQFIAIQDKNASQTEKSISEIKIKDFFVTDAVALYKDDEGVERKLPISLGEALRIDGDEIRSVITVFAFSDYSLKTEAGIKTFRESRLFSVWFMEALRDVEGLTQNSGNEKVFDGKKMADLSVLEYMHLQAKNFKDMSTKESGLSGGANRSIWIPNRIAENGQLVLIKHVEESGKDVIQFNITGGKTPATWGDFDRVGIKIPKDIASKTGFSGSDTAEIPLNHVLFKDGAVEISEAQQTGGDAQKQIETSDKDRETQEQILQLSAQQMRKNALDFQNQGDFKKALSLYRDSLAINVNNADTYNNMGICYAAINEYEDARKSYEHGIALNPNHKEAYNNLGWLLLRSERFDEAIAKFQKGLEIMPNEQQIWTNLAWAYYVKGDYNTAIAENLKILETYPNMLYARYNLGLSYLCIGKSGEAKQEYSKALEGGKDTLAYKSAIDDLNDLIKQNVHKSEAEAMLKILQYKPSR